MPENKDNIYKNITLEYLLLANNVAFIALQHR